MNLFIRGLFNPVKPKLKVEEFSPYLKEILTLHHYKDQLVNAVSGNNLCLHWESYEAHKYKTQGCWFLKQAVHIVTTGL
jgi:hypothetical protein